MMRRSFVGVAAAVLLLPSVAEANFFRSLFQPTVTTCYYPAPIVYVRVVPVAVYPCPVPVVPMQPAPAVPRLATPQPAPPSPEPPLAGQPPVPEVRESRYHDAYSVGGSVPARSADGLCSVGFWNLSGQDLVLHVAGQRVALPRGKSATLQLERRFVWQIEGRPQLVEEVPAGESAREIVIRR